MTRTANAPDLSPVFIAPEPFSPRVERLDALAGLTVAQILTRAVRAGKLALEDLERVAVYVNGQDLETLLESREAMLDYIPDAGDVLNLAVEPLGGGGGGGGNKALQTVLTIAVIALSFYVGGGAATPALLDHLFIRTALAATVNVVGQMAIAAAFSGGGDKMAEANDRRALEGSSNQYRPRAPMPLRLGGGNVGADLAASPYTQNIGNDTFLYVALGWHYGPCILEDIKIGGTLLSDYPAEDIQVEHFLTPGPRSSFLYPGRVVQENMSDQLDQAGGGSWEVRTLAADAERAEVDITFPNGIKYNADSGKIRNEEVSGRIEFAPVGSEAWVGAEIGYHVNKLGLPLPAGTWYVNAKTNDALRKTYSFALPDKTVRYKVRVKSYDDEGQFPSDDRTTAAYWTAIRAIERKAPIVDQTLAVTFMRVRSTDDLNGALPTVSAKVTPIVPIWNGVNWNDEAPSSNAAALARWLVMGPAAAKPYRADQVDASFSAGYELIEARSWGGQVSVTDDASQQDVLIRLGRLGRFSTYWNGRKLCLVTDWEKPVPRQVFAGRNANGYRYRRAFPDPCHGVIVEFNNVDSDSAADELTVYADGFTAETAELLETLRLDFACPIDRAFREGRVYLAKRELQVEVHEWTAGADSIATTYGDRVLVRHLSTLYGLTDCRVDYRHWSGALVAGIRLDQEVTMVEGESYSIDIRRDDGVLRGVPVVTVPGKSRTLTFAAPRTEEAAPQKGDLIVFGRVDLVTEDVEIVDVEPTGPLEATFRAVRYLAPEIMAAETGPIPPLVSGITPRPSAPIPRLLPATGSPLGVVVPFDIEPVRGGLLDGFAARWRRSASDLEPANPWQTLPPLPATAREVRTPPIENAVTTEGDLVEGYRVDVEIRSVLRNGDVSDPALAFGILVTREIARPTGVYATGVTRTGADGSSYPALEVAADSIDVGDVQDLVVEVKLAGSPATDWVTAGQSLPARNPRGDMLNVAGGRSYDVRAKWRAADGWASAWVQTPAPVGIPEGQVASDTINVGGRPAISVLQGIDDLIEVYGDTVAAEASAAAAAASADAAELSRSASAASAANSAAAQAQSETARNQAQAARDASQSARDVAIAQASAAADSAGLSAGYAATTLTYRDAASGSASAAAASAVTANSRANDAEFYRNSSYEWSQASASSASAASTSAGAAGSSASAAQADRVLAQTARGAAESARDSSAASAATADGHRAAAQASETNAANSASASGASAGAAAGSASVASTKAGEASASAASALSSSISATATIVQSLPSTFEALGTYFTFEGAVFNNPPSIGPNTPTAGFASGTERGTVLYSNGQYIELSPKGRIDLRDGRSHRCQFNGIVLADGPRPHVWVSGFHIFNSTGLLLGQWWTEFSDPRTTANGWTNTGGAQSISTEQIRATFPAAAIMRPVALLGWGPSTEGFAGSSFHVDSLRYSDVTEGVAAAGSALASAASASTASASADLAGTRANAADSSRIAAESAKGAAEVARSDAAASASNAAGSASTASTASGVAVTARNQSVEARDSSIGYRDQASGFASASAGSASAASASQTASGQSATSASTSANNANTYAANALSYRDSAASSSSSAAGHAAAAQASALLNARVGVSSMLPNPVMADYTNPNGLPGGWGDWSYASGAPFAYRETDGVESGFNLVLHYEPSYVNQGVYSASIGKINGGGWFVIEATVSSPYGGATGTMLDGAGVHTDFLTGSGGYITSYDLSFRTEPDSRGFVNGMGSGDSTAYRFSKLIHCTDPNAQSVIVYAMSRWAGFGPIGTNESKYLKFHKCNIRAATSLEIETGVARNGYGSVDARITAEESTRASQVAALATRVSSTEANARNIPNLIPNSDFAAGFRHWPAHGAWGVSNNAAWGSIAGTQTAGTQYLISDYIQIYGGNSYTVSYNGDGGSNAAQDGETAVYLSFHRADKSTAADGLAYTPNNNRSWETRKWGTAPAPSDAAFARVIVRKGAGTDSAYVSRLMLNIGASPVAWTDGASALDYAARTSIVESSVADAQAKLSIARIVLLAEATGGRPARMSLFSDSYGGSGIALDAAKIYFGDNSVFDDATDTLQTVWGTTRKVVAWGPPFGPDSLTEWEGDYTVALSAMTKANARVWRNGVAPYMGGTAFAGAGPTFLASAPTVRVKTQVGGSTTVTTAAVAITTSGATGTVSYTWTNTFGAPEMTASYSDGSSATFSAVIPGVARVQTIWTWTATDSGTGISRSGQVYVTIQRDA